MVAAYESKFLLGDPVVLSISLHKCKIGHVIISIGDTINDSDSVLG